MEQQVTKSDFKQDVMKHLEKIQCRIYEIRGVRVMLDFDLAELYQVETRVLKQAVRRNLERFPEDFMFEMTEQEYNYLIISLRSQFVTSNEWTDSANCC